MGQFEVYEDKAGQYRWRLKNSEGSMVAMSMRGFDTKQDAKDDIARVQEAAASAEGRQIEEVDA